MIKLTFCLHTACQISPASSSRNTGSRTLRCRWWRHADVLRQSAPYVQKHSVTDPMNDAIRASRGAPEMYDGVAELWWDSLADITADPTPERAAAGQALLEDERKFIDLPRSPLFFGMEKVIVG